MMEREGRGARLSCLSGGCRCRVRAGCCCARTGRCHAHCRVLAGCCCARAGHHCACCHIRAVVVALALVVVVPVVVFVLLLSRSRWSLSCSCWSLSWPLRVVVIVVAVLVTVVMLLVVVVVVVVVLVVVVVVLVVMVVVVVVVVHRVVGGCRRCHGSDVAHCWRVHVVAESGCMAWGAYTSLSPWWALTTCGSSDEWWGWAWWLVMVGGESVVAVFGNMYESNCQTNKQ